MRKWAAPRFTIRRIMGWVAGFAIFFASLRFIFSQEFLVVYVILGLVGLLGAIVLGINFGSEMALGLHCPACHRLTLRRIARYHRYFRCSICRARFQRTPFGPWRDASSPKDAPRFLKPIEALAWKGFHKRENLDATTSGVLLQNKRHRDRSRPRAEPWPPAKADGSRVDRDWTDD
jgi:hypothetical protein